MTLFLSVFDANLYFMFNVEECSGGSWGGARRARSPLIFGARAGGGGGGGGGGGRPPLFFGARPAPPPPPPLSQSLEPALECAWPVGRKFSPSS